MEKNHLYTIARMSEELGIPESTLRRYTKQFSEFIPSVGIGRKRRFQPEAKEVLVLISQYFSQGLETNDVAIRLEQTYSKTIEASAINTQTPSVIMKPQSQELAVALEHHTQALEAQTAASYETLAILRQQADMNQTMLAALHKLPNSVADEVRKHTLVSRMKRILRIDHDTKNETSSPPRDN